MKKKEYVIPAVQVVTIDLPTILAGSDIFNSDTEYTAGGTDGGTATDDDDQL